MYKAVGIWSWPQDADRDEFEEHYRDVHVPAAEKLPGGRRITLLTGGEDARESRIYRIAEVYWDDEGSFTRAASSPEWEAMAADATWIMERFGVTLSSAHGYETQMD